MVRYTLSIIKRGFNIDSFNIKKDIPCMLYKHMREKIYVVSIDNKDVSEINSIILDIKKKDSVKKARLDVIYSDDKSTTPRVQHSCKIC